MIFFHPKQHQNLKPRLAMLAECWQDHCKKDVACPFVKQIKAGKNREVYHDKVQQVSLSRQKQEHMAFPFPRLNNISRANWLQCHPGIFKPAQLRHSAALKKAAWPVWHCATLPQYATVFIMFRQCYINLINILQYLPYICPILPLLHFHFIKLHHHYIHITIILPPHYTTLLPREIIRKMVQSSKSIQNMIETSNNKSITIYKQAKADLKAFQQQSKPNPNQNQNNKETCDIIIIVTSTNASHGEPTNPKMSENNPENTGQPILNDSSMIEWKLMETQVPTLGPGDGRERKIMNNLGTREGQGAYKNLSILNAKNQECHGALCGMTMND